MPTTMHQLPPGYMQIFYAIQEVLQSEMLQNSPFKGTMRKRSPQEQHHAPSHPHINQFHNPSRPAHSTFANKPHKATRSFNIDNSTRTPINSYSYSYNQIPIYSHSFTSCSPTQTPSNSHHQDTISAGSTLL